MYKDKEKQREATKDRVRRYRDKQKGVTSDEICNTQGVTPDITLDEAYWRRVNERGDLTSEELKTILQWGIDEGRIKVRRKMVERYGLTQRYGPARLDKPQLHELLNSDIKQKKIDSPLYFIGSQARPSFYHSYFAE